VPAVAIALRRFHLPTLKSGRNSGVADSNLMRLRWIPIILAIGFTLSILGGGIFFSQNRTDRIIAICVSIFGLAAIICAVWVLRSYL
jgi:hypothetical protein